MEDEQIEVVAEEQQSAEYFEFEVSIRTRQFTWGKSFHVTSVDIEQHSKLILSPTKSQNMTE